MDDLEKAKSRMQSWLQHNKEHQEEFEKLARRLEEAGQQETADYIREIVQLTARSSQCLRNALDALEDIEE
jgi:ferric-dicitrate binding protein FerR (iron transport regulator)